MSSAKKRMLLYVLVIVFMAGTTLHVQAKVDVKNDKPAAKPPVVIDGDELYYSDLSGDMFAKGNVVVTQNEAQLFADLLRGNAKQNEVWIDDKAVFVQPGTKLVGTVARYNYKTGIGKMAKASGRVGKELIDGGNIEMQPGEVIIHDGGTVTRCPAKIPDYHVSASRVEIWPGEKLIAYNAKFWIKDKVIFSMAKYQKSLTDDGQSEFPQVGFHSRDGILIKQHLEYPLSDKLSAFFTPTWYTKAGWRPAFGLMDRESNYTLGLIAGHYRDSNDNWIKKMPELNLTFGHQVGNLPVDYTFTALYGKWIDSDRSSWHQDYSLYFRGRPIKLSDKFHLYLGTGVETVKESYDKSSRNIFRYDATFYQYWSPRLTTYAGYHYTRNNQTLFAYGRSDLSKELSSGFIYKVDRMNSIGFAQSYDVANHRVHDQDYFWYRDLHCWQLTIEYRAKRHQYIVDFSTKRF